MLKITTPEQLYLTIGNQMAGYAVACCLKAADAPNRRAIVNTDAVCDLLRDNISEMRQFSEYIVDKAALPGATFGENCQVGTSSFQRLAVKADELDDQLRTAVDHDATDEHIQQFSKNALVWFNEFGVLLQEIQKG